MEFHIPSPTTEIEQVVSGAIESAEWNKFSRRLVIHFHQRGSYAYYGVTRDTFESLIEAPSVGRYFNFNIKDNYSYKRIL